MATLQNVLLTKVEHDVGTGWFSIYTDDASVKKTTTKMEQKAREAAAFVKSAERVDLDYSPKQRHDEASGRTYQNNYYERAKPAATSNGASAGGDDGIERIEPAKSNELRRTHPLDAWRMTLAVAAKLAVDTLPMLEEHERSPADQWRLTYWWAMRLYFTPLPEAGALPPESSGVPASPRPSSGAPGAYAEPTFEPAPASDVPFEDDIPF